MYQIRLATPDDIPKIIGLIDQAAEWLTTKGTDQWAKPWPSLQERDRRVRRGVVDGFTWLVEDHDALVGTASCRPDSHSELWGDAETQEPAGYMARLVINRQYAGRNIGGHLTDWIGARAQAEFYAKSVRIDVWTTNVSLHSYYKRCGFTFLRFCRDAMYPSAALFIKPTDIISPTAGSLFEYIPSRSCADDGPTLASSRPTAPPRPCHDSSTIR
jgi:ribosomal protein S18 acetylase RimI-like enzyme